MRLKVSSTRRKACTSSLGLSGSFGVHQAMALHNQRVSLSMPPKRTMLSVAARKNWSKIYRACRLVRQLTLEPTNPKLIAHARDQGRSRSSRKAFFCLLKRFRATIFPGRSL